MILACAPCLNFEEADRCEIGRPPRKAQSAVGFRVSEQPINFLNVGAEEASARSTQCHQHDGHRDMDLT